MGQVNFKFTDPIPPGSAILFKITPLGEDGVTTEALDGELNAVNDQAQAPTNAAGGPINEQPDPLNLTMLVQPPRNEDGSENRAVDSVITGGDTDGDPSFIATIDWDRSSVPVTGKAKQFGFTAEIVPATPPA